MLAAFLREHPHINVDVEERESPDIAQAIAAGAADIGLAIDAAPAGGRSCGCRSATTAWCWWSPPHDELAGRRQVGFAEVLGRDFVGLNGAAALQAHLAGTGGAARLAAASFARGLKDFDAVCQMVAAGIGIAVMPEATAKRCARTIEIRTLRLRDPWASRKLAICVRDIEGVVAAGAATGRAFAARGNRSSLSAGSDRSLGLQPLSSLIAAACTRGSPAATMRPPLCAGLPSQVVTTPPAPVMIGISAAIS